MSSHGHEPPQAVQVHQKPRSQRDPDEQDSSVGRRKDVLDQPAPSMEPLGESDECYLCHKLYSSLHGLKMHHESPRHQQRLYHCMKPSCGREFTTLAALINHLESEVCKLVRFQQVQKVVERIVGPHMMLST